MGHLTTTTDEWTALQSARLRCVCQCDLFDLCGHRDPNICATYRRLGAPRPALVPSDAEIRRTYDTWALTMMAAMAVFLFLVALFWLGGA